MRLAFLLLLAANLGFFAWARFLASPDQSVDRAPMQRQLEPQKLRIVSERELPRAAPPAPSKPKPAASVPAPAAQPPAPIACLEWGGFSTTEAARVAQRLEPLALGERLAQVRGEETAIWWVHMPPQGNRAGAQKKAEELKAIGVRDYFIMQEPGRWQWALSLGVFSTEAAANAHLEALRARGVRTAIIGQRDTRVTKLWFQVRDVDPALQGRLKEIAAEFDGMTLHECAPRS